MSRHLRRGVLAARPLGRGYKFGELATSTPLVTFFFPFFFLPFFFFLQWWGKMTRVFPESSDMT